ncbi:pantothenate kinase [Seinonella peptonophila]|uniref:Type III pantothenate kinase n=1 Tax=Seinonella peptonophila TaxID=112248 RepID=A0A1M4YTE6_9BACL|nr:type III pantothenate kinase [Seinonella peptonophila]SHF08606.1 pantothenate kinase [Seinonella peptonophila]
MLFVIDVGNTNIVLGIYRERELVYHWRIHTDREATEDEYAMLIKNLLQDVHLKWGNIKGVAISSVVPPLTYVLRKWSEKYLSIDPIVLEPGVKTGMNILYDSPRDVGADRIVNAVAASEKFGGPVIIVDFGTATTFCLVDEHKNYRGGIIAPGIHVSLEALVSRTAKLPRVEVARPEEVVGRNTINAMQSGLYYGYVGSVDGVVNRIKQTLTKKPTVVATGGLARLIAEDADTIDYIEPWLTLEGLRLIYERNRGEQENV